ncbi:MAG: DNA primase [Anaerolineales bacterium]|nr:DNA primase [Anaerolineales bacterium]
MSVTEEIKARLDIVDIVGETVQLRKSGRSLQGFCPFHQNTRTPSFHVFPHTQTWHCFGACAEGGDVFSYVMKRDNIEFREALEILARRAGVELEPYHKKDEQQEAAEARQAGLLEAVADYFHQLLLYAPQADYARRYVAGRDLNEATLSFFKLGYALNSWDACRDHFLAQGYTQEELLQVGLLSRNDERGTVYDRFRDRLIFPIRDLDGKVVGFGARTLAKDGIPKYLNSPQTDMFDKGRLLYGLDFAKQDIREAKQVVIVEGYMDVIRAWQAGFRNVVAQMGTALTPDQLRLLKRYTTRFVMALDADAAGASATMRSLQVARETLDRETEIVFDARGLVRQEGRLQADIRVVTMPEGEDPDSLIRANPAAWPQLLAKARPIVAYVIELSAADLDMQDPKAKADVARQVLPLIADIQNAVERDHYRQLLATTLRIDERSLRQMWAEQNRSRKRPGPPPTWGDGPDASAGNSADRRLVTAKQGNGTARRVVGSRLPGQQPVQGGAINTHMRETYVLRRLLEEPALLTQVDSRLLEVEQKAVHDQDFSRTEDQVVWRELHGLLRADGYETLESFVGRLDNSLQDHVRSILQAPAGNLSENQRQPETLALAILDCRLERAKMLLREVNQQFHSTDNEDNQTLLETHQQLLRELPLLVNRINRAKHTMSAMSRRGG